MVPIVGKSGSCAVALLTDCDEHYRGSNRDDCQSPKDASRFNQASVINYNKMHTTVVFNGTRNRFRRGMPADKTSSSDPMDKMPAADEVPPDADLVSLLRTSLKNAFVRANRERLLLLHLVYLHGIKQRELADIYGCNESTISRWLNATLEQIHDDTLHEVEDQDTAVRLDWREILQLCDIINQELNG
jgi:Homeodomain-like domain